MEYKTADLLGKTIISVENARTLGKIKDVVYDPEKNRVTAFLVEEGDIISKPNLLPVNEIDDIDQNSVFVKSEKAIKPQQEVFDTIENETELSNSLVEKDTGEKIGLLKDMFFEAKSGKVNNFVVKGGRATRKVPVKKVIDAKSDKTIISDEKELGAFRKLLKKIKDNLIP